MRQLTRTEITVNLLCFLIFMPVYVLSAFVCLLILGLLLGF